MHLHDFKIDTEFFAASGKWRCTDVGSRTIIAVKLGPRKVVSVDTEQGTVTGSVQDDESCLAGPPYAVEEVVFDENDIRGCHLDLDRIA